MEKAVHIRSRSGATSAESKARQRSRHGWLLAALSLAQLIVVLDSTIVNIALPQAEQALGFSASDRQWVVTAYALSFGGLLLLGGRISDRIGQKRVLIVGLVGFAVASFVGGGASSLGVLILARAVQGAFGALLAPAALSLLTVVFREPAERARAFGVFGSVSGAGAAVGLVLGGALTEYGSWSWCLWVNVPLCVIAIVGAIVLLPEMRGDRRIVLDIPSTVTVTASTVALILGFSSAGTSGWGTVPTVVLLAVGVLTAVLFVVLQHRTPNPLLPLRIVLDRRRAGALIGIAASAVGMFAVFLFLTFHLQQSFQLSPLISGLAFLPMIAAITVLAIAVTPRLLPRFGSRLPIALGSLLGGAGLLLLSTLTTTSTYAATVLSALVVIGVGLGLIFGTAFEGVTAGVQPQDAGVASALANTSQQVFGALGTALLSTIALQAITANEGSSPAAAAIAGYDSAFFSASLVFFAAALVTAVLIPGPTDDRSRSATTDRS